MKIPLKEKLGAIPGVFGIRLEQEPPFRLIQEDDAFQLRRYEAMVLAQTEVGGGRDYAMNEGFERLAGYIFGGNTRENEMSMTTPVFQEKKGRSWKMSFVLEEEYTLANAPEPVDGQVKLTRVPAKTVATYRYSGNNTAEAMREAATELKKWLKKQDLKAVGSIYWAQYDQPFAVPFLKRNEAHVEVAAEVG